MENGKPAAEKEKPTNYTISLGGEDRAALLELAERKATTPAAVIKEAVVALKLGLLGGGSGGAPQATAPAADLAGLEERLAAAIAAAEERVSQRIQDLRDDLEEDDDEAFDVPPPQAVAVQAQARPPQAATPTTPMRRIGEGAR